MRRIRFLLALFAFACLGSAMGEASEANCPEHFWHGVAPVLSNARLSSETREICYSGYAVLHSGVSRTPLWSAEHLSRDRVEAARDLLRIDAFHPDPNLPEDERAELSDYSRSGYDRGHMAPSGDMDTPEAMAESFSLANIVPQNSENNRHLWERIERAVRDLAAQEGELYVVTGPIFQGDNLQSLKGRVLVPTQLFKAVYDPRRNAAGAYVVQNAEGDEYRVVSIAELQQLAGIDVFPALPDAIKQKAAELPPPGAPRPRFHGKTARVPSGRPQNETIAPTEKGGDFIEGILNAIDRMGRRR